MSIMAIINRYRKTNFNRKRVILNVKIIKIRVEIRIEKIEKSRMNLLSKLGTKRKKEEYVKHIKKMKKIKNKKGQTKKGGYGIISIVCQDGFLKF